MLNQCLTTVFPTGKPPPEKEKPATVAAAAGSELVCENSEKTTYQLSIAPATINERQAWQEAGLSTGKTVAGLHVLASEGLIVRTPHGFALKWEQLQ